MHNINYIMYKMNVNNFNQQIQKRNINLKQYTLNKINLKEMNKLKMYIKESNITWKIFETRFEENKRKK